MTGSWKERKGVAVGLAVLALGVWGAVGHALWAEIQPTEGETGEVATGRSVAPSPMPAAPAPHAYDGDYRDPFLPQLRPAPVAAEVPIADLDVEEDAFLEPPPVEPQLPPMRLVGVVGESALVEVDGFIQLVRRGDFIDDVEVVEVRKNEMRVVFHGNPYLIALS